MARHHFVGKAERNRSAAQPPINRLGDVEQARLEGGRVLVTLTGAKGEQPPGDLAGFAAYADTLPTPDTSRVIAAVTSIEA